MAFGLDTILPARADERRLTLALFTTSFFCVGSVIVGRTVRDALFLAHADKKDLGLMYLLSAIAVSAASLLYLRLGTGRRKDRNAAFSAAFSSAVFLGAWYVQRHPPFWFYPALYIFAEVAGSLLMLQFWVLANEMFHSREAKRLYGFIGAGGTLATIAVGLLSAQVSIWFGASSLILVCAALSLGSGLLSMWVGTIGRQRLFAKAAFRSPTRRKLPEVFAALSSGHLKTVAIIVAVTFFTTTLLDFQFKVIASSAYRANELAAFFGFMSAVVGVIALVLQLFGTSTLLQRFGVIASLAVLPAFLGTGSLFLALVPSLAAATLTKGADLLFRYTINDATSQILYLPAPASLRPAAKAAIDGIVKPFAIAISGAILAIFSERLFANLSILAWLCVSLCALWMIGVISLRAHYIASLHETLRSRKFGLDPGAKPLFDGATGRILNEALEGKNPREVLNALELAWQLNHEGLDERVEKLLAHEDPNVRVAALAYFGHRQAIRFANAVYSAFEDTEPKVRAAAIEAFCAIGRDKSVKNVRAFLADPDPAVRSAAITGMIRYGGLDGVLIAAEALKQLIEHPEASMREHAAKILGAIGVTNFYQPVLQLMNDEDVRVRRQAILSAGVLKSSEFVIPLIYKTKDPRTLREAIDALFGYGDAILPTLSKVLSNPKEEAPIRRACARVLGRLASAEAIELLVKHLDDSDVMLRSRLYRSLGKLAKTRQLRMKDKRPVTEALERELAEAYQALQSAETLKLSPHGNSAHATSLLAAEALLLSALEEKAAAAESRVFVLLSVLYPDADMEFIHAGLSQSWEGGRRRANAVELLENLLDRDLKGKILPLIDELSRAEKLTAVAVHLPLPKLSPDETIQLLGRDASVWVRVCAIWFASRQSGPWRKLLFDQAEKDSNRLVKETLAIAKERALRAQTV